MKHSKKILTAAFLLYMGVIGSVALASVKTETAEAATTYTVHNMPNTTLKFGIAGADTTGIKLNPPSRNGVDIEWATKTGGILEFSQPGKIEYIYYSLATTDSDKVVTLTGSVVRGYCFDTNSFASCESGRRFDAGAKVRLIFDMRLINFSAKIDIVNTTTGSGSFECGNARQGCIVVGEYTTAEIAGFTYKQNSTIVIDTTRGVPLARIGDAWVNMTGTGSDNGTEAVRGVYEAATLAEQGAHNATGSTAASLVLQSKNTIKIHSIYTGATLDCGTGATQVLGTWTGTSSGAFTVEIDGIRRVVNGIDFTGDGDMFAVADTIQARLREVTGSTENVNWIDGNGTGFILKSANTTSGSSITRLSLHTGATVDVSGEGATAYMDCDYGSANTVTITGSSIDLDEHENRIVVLNESGTVNIEFLATGTADGTKFVRDDGKLVTPTLTPDVETTGIVVSSGAFVGYSSTSDDAVTMNLSGSNAISNLEAGDAIEFELGGTHRLIAGTLSIRIKMDGNELCYTNISTTAASTRHGWNVRGTISIYEVHAGGVVSLTGFMNSSGDRAICADSSAVSATSPQTFDNSGSEAITVTAQFSSSNSGHDFNVTSGYIKLNNTP